MNNDLFENFMRNKTGKVSDTNNWTERRPARTNWDEEPPAKNHQESALNKLTAAQQIDVLKFAQSHQIMQNDPAWMLVEMLGHVRFTTDTLPARIEAAGNNAVEAINQQRLIEQKAFSTNALRELDSMLNTISQRFAKEAKNITDEQLHRRLMINGMMTTSWITLLITGSVVCGYLLAQGHIYWATEDNHALINVLSIIFNLPAGYIICPGFIIALIVIVRQVLKSYKKK